MGTIKDLNNSIKDLVEKNEALRVEVIKSREEATFLQEKNAGLRSEEAELKAENHSLKAENNNFKMSIDELRVENKGFKSEVDELKAKTRLLVDARRSSQILGQTDVPTASLQDIPMGNSQSLRVGEYPVAPFASVGPVASVRSHPSIRSTQEP